MPEANEPELGAPVDDRARNRIAIEDDANSVAELVYRIDGDRLVLLHTEVPEAWRGRGVGGSLVEAAVERAVSDGLTVVPWCPFARRWLRDHPDAAGQVTVDWKSDPTELAPVCSHLDRVDPAPVPKTRKGCEECLAAGGRWVHLRLCLDCGHVGCCDSSPSRHATAHHRDEGHPLVRSYEPGEDWWWCYVDETLFEIEGAPPAPSHP